MFYLAVCTFLLSWELQVRADAILITNYCTAKEVQGWGKLKERNALNSHTAKSLGSPACCNSIFPSRPLPLQKPSKMSVTNTKINITICWQNDIITSLRDVTRGKESEIIGNKIN